MAKKDETLETEVPFDTDEAPATPGALTQYLGSVDVTTFDDAQMGQALQASLEESGSAAVGASFLKFSGKTGVYQYGRKNEPVDEKVFIVEPLSFVQGWVCWKGGKAVGKHIWSTYKRKTDAVTHSALEDKGPYNENVGEGWKEMRGLGMLDPELGVPVRFELTSASGINVIEDLVREVAHRSMHGEPNIPIVSFAQEEFEAQGQWNWKPIIEVETWVSRAEMTSYQADEISLQDLLDAA